MESPPPYSEETLPGYDDASTENAGVCKLRCNFIHCESLLDQSADDISVKPGPVLGHQKSQVELKATASFAELQRALLLKALNTMPSVLDCSGEVLFWLHLESNERITEITKLGEENWDMATHLSARDTQMLRLTITLVEDVRTTQSRHGSCVVQ
jgi:hypothetical protein